jgi:hypothetical protein
MRDTQPGGTGVDSRIENRMKTIRHKHTRSEGAPLALLTALGLAGLVSAAALPALSRLPAPEHEPPATAPPSAPGADRLLSGKWRANVRTWAAMIRYLFEPEPDRPPDNQPSPEQR